MSASTDEGEDTGLGAEILACFLQAAAVEQQQQHVESPLNYPQDIAAFSLPSSGEDAPSAVPPATRAKRAELARESRRRKKQRIKNMEETVSALEKRLEELRERNKAASPRATVHMEKDTQLVNNMTLLMEQGGKEEELQDKVNLFIQVSRDSAFKKLEKALDRVEETVITPIEIKFAMWGLDQNEEFYENPFGIWNSLMYKEIGISKEQIDALRGFRHIMRKQRQEIFQVEKDIQNLRDSCISQHELLDQNMSLFYQILTPQQLAKFFTWIEQNQWCMEMLNNAWGAQNEEKKD
jgi:molybdopterin converting factor small subunit